MPEYSRALVWYRRDLRDFDHGVQRVQVLTLFKQASGSSGPTDSAGGAA